jgi:Cu-processing system permease protein
MRADSPLSLCAGQELRLAVRSRWTQIFAAVFAALALAVAGSGYVLAGGGGVQDFARTATSLVELVVLLVPLTALLLGVLAFTPERGAAELLFSQPVRRRDVLLGTLAGLFLALGAAQALGFGAAGALIFWRAGEAGLGGYLLLVLTSLALTAIFLGIAAWIAGGVGGASRVRALAVALVVWFGGIVLYDVVALGAAALLPSGYASRLLMIAVVANPADAARTAALLGMQGTTAFGAASLAFLRFTGGAFGAAACLAGSLLLWLVAPPLAGAWRLRRRDL